MTPQAASLWCEAQHAVWQQHFGFRGAGPPGTVHTCPARHNFSGCRAVFQQPWAAVFSGSRWSGGTADACMVFTMWAPGLMAPRPALQSMNLENDVFASIDAERAVDLSTLPPQLQAPGPPLAADPAGWLPEPASWRGSGVRVHIVKDDNGRTIGSEALNQGRYLSSSAAPASNFAMPFDAAKKTVSAHPLAARAAAAAPKQQLAIPSRCVLLCLR